MTRFLWAAQIAVVASVCGGTAFAQNAICNAPTTEVTTADDPEQAIVASVPAGCDPVRIAPTGTQEWLSVIDVSKTGQGAAAVIGSVPVGAFPRELRVTADGNTLLVTNFISRTLELVDLARLSSTYLSEQAQARKSR
jgi:DNA-binding beta-propeller fold protein YncE